MGKFQKSQNLPRLNHEDMDLPNSLITSKQIEPVIKKNLSAKKGPGLDGFPDEFYQTFKELTPSFLKLPPKN